MAESKKDNAEQGKLVVHLLVIALGVTSWSIMNGLWVELPILVAHLPEGWTLPSLLTIISQFGNLGPLTFLLLTWLFPKTKLETPVSVSVVIALTICAMLYAFLWTETATIGGVHFSVAILVLTLCQSIFAATSSMSYLAFMSHLKARYISSIFIGQGLSGLLPAFVAIGQGAGDVRCLTYHNTSRDDLSSWNNYTADGDTNATLVAVNIEPDFSVRAFFLILFALGCLSLFALLLLVAHPYCRTEHVDTEQEENCQLLVKTERQITDITHTKAGPAHISAEQYFTTIENCEGSKVDSSTTKFQSSGPDKNDPSTNNSLPTGHTDWVTSDGGNNIFTVQSSDNTSAQRVIEPAHASNEDLHCVGKGTNYVVCKTNQDGLPTSNIPNQPQKQQEVTSHTLPKVESEVERPSAPPLVNPECGEAAGNNTKQGRESTNRWRSWYLLALLIWINVLQTSYVLAIQVYSSLPYGLRIYNGVTKAENIVDPLACVVTLFVTAQRTRVISGLTLLGTLFAAYIIMVAAMSPHPFLVDETMGGVLVIAAWVMCTVLMVFSKVSIASVMRAQGRKSLIWTGASSQLGALIGAILAYVMINQLDLFKDGPWC